MSGVPLHSRELGGAYVMAKSYVWPDLAYPVETVFSAAAKAAVALGYSVTEVSAPTVMSFNTGLSLWSARGQDVTVALAPIDAGATSIALSVSTAGGQWFGWGEGENVINAFLGTLASILTDPQATPPSNRRQDEKDERVDRLAKLADLLAQGLLSEDEFNREKGRLLAP